MYILVILAYPLKIYVIRNVFFKTQTSLNPISMNIYFSSRHSKKKKKKNNNNK